MSIRGRSAFAVVSVVAMVSGFVFPARGEAPVDVVVTNVGAGALEVRVAEGGTTIGAAHEIFSGDLQAEAKLTLKTGQRCVWIEQTLGDASGPWSAAKRFCRPQLCKGEGRSYACETIEGAPIKVDVDGTP